MFSREPFLYENEIRLMNVCVFCRRRETIFKICFLVIGSIKYGCCTHVVEIIQKIYLQ